ncbi:MAG: VOC family protein [Phycisphaerales bacterium]|nr:VOC family protein [Phycisphaerales bacterium]
MKPSRSFRVVSVAGVLGVCCAVSGCETQKSAERFGGGTGRAEARMQLGNFSVSLAVKDLAASRAFYEKLGFRAIGGEPSQGWLILQNDTATIGLFQGMFPRNILTFNPGWDRACGTLPTFEDVRSIQERLRAQGLTLATEADPNSTGPGSLMLTDPDGNPVLIDQHVPRPK